MILLGGALVLFRCYCVELNRHRDWRGRRREREKGRKESQIRFKVQERWLPGSVVKVCGLVLAVLTFRFHLGNS